MATENALTLLTIVLIKPLLITLIVMVGFLLLQKKSAALQHFWLVTGLTALLLLPFLFSILPELEWQILPQSADASFVLAWLYEAAMWFSESDHLMVVAAVYFLGALWLVFYLILGIFFLMKQTREAKRCYDADMLWILRELSEEMDITRKVALLISPKVASPHMWGVFKPVILLPVDANEWSHERKLSVLLHELGHVARYDWATTIIVKICCALFWFIPHIWWLAQRLFHCAEIACDDYIYRLHEDYQLRNKEIVYAENLLAMAQCARQAPGHSVDPVLSMAGRSPIFQRIEAVLNRQRLRNNATPEARQYWVLVLLMLLLPLASLQLLPIQKTLLSNVLKIQLQELDELQIARRVTAEEATPVHRLTAATLQQLKQHLRVEDAPELPLEQLIVTKRRSVIDDYSLPSNIPGQHIASVPTIHIRGYMPLHIAVPVYPRNALQRGTEGEVVVQFSIAEDGSIIAPKILHSQPRKIFDQAVLAALQASRYQPQIIDGHAVVIDGVVETFSFQIEQSAFVDERQR